MIISSKIDSEEFSTLPRESLAELGGVMAQKEKMLNNFCNPLKTVAAKLGFSPGYNCHFHMLPVTEELMKEIAGNAAYSDTPDGNDALLFASREYCERPLSATEKKNQLRTARDLRKLFQDIRMNESP